MRTLRLFTILLVCLAPAQAAGQFRTHNDRFAPPHFTSRADWDARAAYLREHVLASAGLLPLPEKCPLHAVVFDDVTHADYTRVEGLLREPPRVLRDGQSLPAGRRRSVPGGAVAARTLDVRPSREHARSCRVPAAPSTSRARGSSCSCTTWSATTTAGSFRTPSAGGARTSGASASRACSSGTASAASTSSSRCRTCARTRLA